MVMEALKEKYPYPYPCPEDLKRTDPEKYKACVKFWTERAAGKKEELSLDELTELVANVARRYYRKYYYPYYYYKGRKYYYYPYYCPKGQVWDPRKRKCVPLEELEEYREFMAKCMKEGKTMEECARIWKEKYAGKYPAAQEEEGEIMTPDLIKTIVAKLENHEERIRKLEGEEQEVTDTDTEEASLEEETKAEETASVEEKPAEEVSEEKATVEETPSEPEVTTEVPSEEEKPITAEDILKAYESKEISAVDLVLKWAEEVKGSA